MSTDWPSGWAGARRPMGATALRRGRAGGRGRPAGRRPDLDVRQGCLCRAGGRARAGPGAGRPPLPPGPGGGPVVGHSGRDQPVRPEGHHPRRWRHRHLAARAAGTVPGARPPWSGATRTRFRVRPGCCRWTGCTRPSPTPWWWSWPWPSPRRPPGSSGRPSWRPWRRRHGWSTWPGAGTSTPPTWWMRWARHRSPVPPWTSPIRSRCPTVIRCGTSTTASSRRTRPTPSRWWCRCWRRGSAPTWSDWRPGSRWSDWSTPSAGY